MNRQHRMRANIARTRQAITKRMEANRRAMRFLQMAYGDDPESEKKESDEKIRRQS